MQFNRFIRVPLWVFLLSFYVSAAQNSTGSIEVYFSHAIDDDIAGDVQPAGIGYPAMLDVILKRINQAEQRIDVAMYNNNRTDLTNALKAAHARGVQVRYIAAAATANYALNPAPPFPVLYGNADDLMHNKFMIIDADLPDKAWVMSGSLNWTTSNITEDYNNLLFIQDQALAKAYQVEFEEMWGGTGAQPEPVTARFGAAKTNNTPNSFLVGGKLVQLWFSPSDNVTDHIVEALASADHCADFALFSFTKNEIGNILVDLFEVTGIPVQGMIENTGDLGCEINYLNANGIPVYDHNPSGNLHHKYGVVDAGFPASAPLVITGSHNWTNAAENYNDENTLVIHDPDIALLFKAEFSRRWAENLSDTRALAYQNWEIYPNPVENQLFIQATDDAAEAVLAVEIWDLSGRLFVQNRYTGFQPVLELDLMNLPKGHYAVKILTQNGVATFPVQKI